MPARLLLFVCLTLTAFGRAQNTPPGHRLVRLSGKIAGFGQSAAKTPCESGSTLAIISCDGETDNNGDFNPADGAFMEWAASGTDTLFYSQIYNGTDTFRIINPLANDSPLYTPDDDGTQSWDLEIGAGANGCLPPGDWTVRVWSVTDRNDDREPDTDENGDIIGCFVECNYSFQPTCSRQTSPAFTPRVRNTTCGENNGSIRVGNLNTDRFYCVDANGTGLDFSWAGPNGFTSTETNLSDLEAGDYSVTLTDIYGCANVVGVSVGEDPPVAVACAAISPPSSIFANDGQASITITDGTGPFTIRFSGPSNGVRNNRPVGETVLTGLSAGTYTVTVTDTGTDCETTCFFTIEEAPCLVGFTVNAETDGAGVVSVTITPTGGTPNFTLTYSGPTDSPAPVGPFGNEGITLGGSDFAFGTYRFILTEQFRPTCQDTVEVILEANSCAIAVTCTPTPPASPAEGGSVELTFDQGPDYSYEIFAEGNPTEPVVGDLTSAQTVTVEDLPPGNYRVTVINFGGCTGACAFTIGEAPCGLTASATPTYPTCAGATDGSIELVVAGATSGLTADWDRDELDGQLAPEGLAAGTYNVTVTDDSGCTVPLSVDLTDPPGLSLALSTDGEVACAGGAGVRLTTAVTNGTGPFTFLWSVDTFPDAPEVADVAAGTYWVEVTDANGCGGTATRASVVVEEPEPLRLSCTPTAETTLGAEDGSLEFLLSGGTAPYARFSLNETDVDRPAADRFTGLAAGTYTLEIEDANGCTTACTTTVNQGGCGNATVSIVAIQPDCDNPLGSATAMSSSTTGNVSYLWSNGAATATVTDLPPGDYSVSVTDANDCDATGTVTIDPFTDVPGVTIGEFSVVCGEDCTTIGGTFTGTPPFRLAYVADLAGTQVQGDVMSSDVQLVRDFCPGDFGITDFDASSLRFTAVTDANGCTRMIDEVRRVPHGFAGRFDLTDVLCPGDTLFVGQESFYAGRPTGEVVIPGGAVGGCDSLIAVSLQFPAPARGALDTVLCTGQLLDINGEIFGAERPAGEVLLVSAGGCDSLVDVRLTFNSTATLTLDGGGLDCDNNPLPVRLVYDGPGTVEVTLSDAPDDPFPVSAGETLRETTITSDATVSILNVNTNGGCPVTSSGTAVFRRNDLSADVLVVTDPALECGVTGLGALAADATGGLPPYTITWNTGATTPIIDSLDPGDYRVVVTDAAGCSVSVTATVTATDGLDLRTTVLPPTCQDTFAVVFVDLISGSTGPYLYRLGETGFLPADALPLRLLVPASTPFLEIEDATGCRAREDFTFDRPVVPILTLMPAEATVPFGDSVLVRLQTNLTTDSFRLSPGVDSVLTGNSLWLPALASATYEFSVVDAEGCRATATFRLTADRSYLVYAPTAFSPNADGTNEVFRIFGGDQVARIEACTLYDRWGARVYDLPEPVDARDPAWGWAGTNPDGRPYPTGVYTYSARLSLREAGREVTVKGEVTLVR